MEVMMDPTTSPLTHTQVKDHINTLEPTEALAWIEELINTCFDRSPQELAHMLLGIQDAAYDRIDEVLQPFMATERSDEVKEDALRIDNELMWELVEEINFVHAENGELAGTSVDRWFAQKGDK